MRDGAIPAPYRGNDEEDLWPEEIEALEARAKGDALKHSRPLDIHKWSEHPEVNNFITPIYEKYFKGRKGRIRKKHLKVVLLDLYVAWRDDPALKVTYSRNVNDYKAGSRYNELHISHLTINVVDALEAAGLVEHAKGFFDRDRKAGLLSRMWPTEALIALFREAKFSKYDVDYSEDRLVVVLRDKNPETGKAFDVEYDETEETKRMSSVVHAYNLLLKKTFIDVPDLEDVRGINLSHRFTRRVFNRKSFDKGGRFSGGWWQYCKKEIRKKIHLNDRPTNEIDFSGLHLVMLYALEGFSYWEEMNNDDPYVLPEIAFIPDAQNKRSIAKALTLMLINASSPQEAYNAFRDEANTGTPEKKFTNAQLEVIQKALEDKHPKVSKYFGADIGVTLMNYDSQITEKIIEEFVAHDVPILSIHDSYIVPCDYEDWLIETMQEAFGHVMKLPLDRFPPTQVVEQADRIEDLEGSLMSWMPYDEVKEYQEEMERKYLDRVRVPRSGRYIKELEEFNEWIAQQ
ncbi:hypothetical protein WH96_01195 [Kiloniella spongiae]|uniref:DNA-directed RNA polymerase n=1 Tax=Kiloniella spongiae TaxID=1489064 RepID=A0A0H2MHW0_9PROT|nr:hypothetical protein [Kiloniella spongiae]KLN62179.1 hypothetical protein WH96_01195 [Kiloniella spongiae]